MWFWPNFRRLPSLLRVASIVSLLCIFASLLLSTGLVFHLTLFFPPAEAGRSRLQLVSINIGLLGVIMGMVCVNFHMRLRQVGGPHFPLGTWRGQVLGILVLTAVPLGGLVLALALPPSLPVYSLVFGISMLGAWITLGGFFWMLLWRPSVA